MTPSPENPANSDPLLVVTARDPLPDGTLVDFLGMPDGTRIRVARFGAAPASDSVRGTVVILQGRTEFIEKYFETVETLRARGFAVATLDWRGQGRSDRPLKNPQKGHVEDFGQYIADLQEVYQRWIHPNCPGPYSMLAHSMGGNIGLRYLAENPGDFQRGIFSAPMFGLGQTTHPGTGMRFGIRVAQRLGLSEHYISIAPSRGDFTERNHSFERNGLTHDRERFSRVLAQLTADPRLLLGAPTFGWVAAALQSMDALFVPGFPETLKTPIHIVTAAQDSVVSAPAHAELTSRLPQAERTILEGAQHEILIESDPCRNRFFEIFDAFMA